MLEWRAPIYYPKWQYWFYSPNAKHEGCKINMSRGDIYCSSHESRKVNIPSRTWSTSIIIWRLKITIFPWKKWFEKKTCQIDGAYFAILPAKRGAYFPILPAKIGRGAYWKHIFQYAPPFSICSSFWYNIGNYFPLFY